VTIIVRFQVLTAASMNLRVFSDVAPCSHVEYDQGDESFIALVMEAVHNSETSINFNVTTQRYIPED
jgi:hypothetical protein